MYRALRWSEHYTKTDMIYLSKGGFWLFLSYAVAVLVGLAVSVSFAHFLPKETFGIYKFVIGIFGILTALSLTGLRTALVPAIARGESGILRSGFFFHLRWSMLVTLSSVAVALYYYTQGNMTLFFSLLIVGSTAPFFLSSSLYASYFEGRKLFRAKFFLNLVHNSTPAITLISTALLTSNPLILIAVYFFSNTATVLLLYLFTVRHYTLPVARSRNVEKNAVHLSAMNIPAIIAGGIDAILIFHFLGATPLAIYAFALAPISHLSGGTKILKTLILPKVSSRDFSEVGKSLFGKTIKLFLALTVVAGAYVLFAPYLFSFLFPQYMEAVIYSQVLAISLLLSANIPIVQTFIGHSKMKEMYTLRFLSSGTRIVALLVLVPLYGLWGAVAAILISGVVDLATPIISLWWIQVFGKRTDTQV